MRPWRATSFLRILCKFRVLSAHSDLSGDLQREPGRPKRGADLFMKTFASRCAGVAAVLAISTGVLLASAPSELSLVGMVAGRGLYQTDSTSAETSFDEEWARMVSIARMDQRLFADQPAEMIWEQAQGNAQRALAILARIAQIDNRKPDNFDVALSLIKAATEDTEQKERREWGKDAFIRIFEEIRKSGLQEEFRHAESALDAKLGELATTASTFPVPGIGVESRPSWQGAYDNDVLELSNLTNRDLVQAAVFVTIYSEDGSHVTHIHRANRWASGQKVYFKYPYYGSDYALGQTVNQPARLEVSVFGSDGSHFQGTKVWGGNEFDNMVQSYIRDLAVSATFLGPYIEEGSGTAYYPGVKFSMQGLHRLPVRRIKVRLTRRDEVKEVYWDWNKFLASGEEIVLRSADFNQFTSNDPPDVKEIALDFTDTTVEAVYRF